ncbi:hypothetical protein ACIBCR_23290 [Micromonospora echinospora]
MPWVKAHTRRGRRVRAHHRVASRWWFGLGIILLILVAGLQRQHGWW